MIQPHETEIIGKWIEVDGRVIGDEACERVESITHGYLERLGYSEESGGWESLFRDPVNGQYWERTYPQSYMHGGGPPALIRLSKEEAEQKYSHLFK
jgi:hypothetical protein